MVTIGDYILYENEVYRVTEINFINDLPAYVAVEELEMMLAIDEFDVIDFRSGYEHLYYKQERLIDTLIEWQEFYAENGMDEAHEVAQQVLNLIQETEKE